MTASDVLATVSTFYLGSSDFNGISLAALSHELQIPSSDLRDHLRALVSGGQIELAFASHSGNPHIKRVEPLPAAEQLERLDAEAFDAVCAYPSALVLATIARLQQYNDRPFTKRLVLGEAQLSPAFFELSILENYFRDPRYDCRFTDYSGSISVKTQHFQSVEMPERHKVLVETFGIGYDSRRNRVVVVYLRYLARLSPEHQQIWRAHELPELCAVNSDYALASIWGQWPTNHSGYEAFLQEQIEINQLVVLIGKPPLFKETFDGERRPLEFGPMLRPTRRSFHEFVHTLDKMLSENVSRAFFERDLPMEERIEGKDGSTERRPLGTLTLLERWLSGRYRDAEGADVGREVLTAFREVRKLRQRPAHSLSKDEYDSTLPRQQDELLTRAIHALTILRLIFSSHPLATAYSPPDWLDGDRIVLY